MLCKLIRIRENNKRTVEQMFNLEDYKLKSIIVSSPFQTLAFLLASLLLSQTSPHAAICSISTVKKAELAPLQKKLSLHHCKKKLTIHIQAAAIRRVSTVKKADLAAS